MKTENGRGQGGGGWSYVKDLIELIKQTEVITISPELRARVLERARQQTELWAREHDPAGDEAHGQAAHPARPTPRQAAQGPGSRAA